MLDSRYTMRVDESGDDDEADADESPQKGYLRWYHEQMDTWDNDLGTPAAAAGADNNKPTNPKDAVGIAKAPLSCVPAVVLAELGLAMMEGALKYGRYNYLEAGVRASVYYDAFMRHMLAYWLGEDIDPESGIDHRVKAMACLTVWRAASIYGTCEDDRGPTLTGVYQDLNAAAKALLTQHAEVSKTVKHVTERNRVIPSASE